MFNIYFIIIFQIKNDDKPKNTSFRIRAGIYYAKYYRLVGKKLNEGTGKSSKKNKKGVKCLKIVLFWVTKSLYLCIHEH